MKHNKTLVSLLVVIVMIIVGYSIITIVPHNPTDNQAVTEDPSTVHYYCDTGTMAALFDNDTHMVHLKLSDGRTIDLNQTIAGSGMRYESGKILFTGKGDNATLSEGDTITYDHCVAGVVSATPQESSFSDTGKTFSISFPKSFSISGGGIGFDTTWRTNVQTPGLLLVKITSPRNLQPKTNLSNITITVGTSSDPEGIKNCLVAKNGEVATGSTTINTINYSIFTLSDAAAGNLYTTTSYRTIHNDMCYAVEFTIHSTNVGNYPPDQGIKEFDVAPIDTIIQQSMQSFKLL